MVGLTPRFRARAETGDGGRSIGARRPGYDGAVAPKPVGESRALLAHLMGPTDANGSGNIHGGTIMKLTDEVAALAAVKHARTRVVTVGMDRMDFLVPIYVGALVTFTACVNAAWRTSMEVGVRVEAENVLDGTIEHTNTAYLTFVALG